MRVKDGVMKSLKFANSKRSSPDNCEKTFKDVQISKGGEEGANLLEVKQEECLGDSAGFQEVLRSEYQEDESLDARKSKRRIRGISKSSAKRSRWSDIGGAGAFSADEACDGGGMMVRIRWLMNSNPRLIPCRTKLMCRPMVRGRRTLVGF
jgi:hypothetical protein